MKKFTRTGMLVGSALGGYAPLWWGGELLSVTSILLAGAGGFLGIYLGFKIGRMTGM